MRCTCIVHNIFFLFCVLKVLNLTCSGFQSTCFWTAGSESFRVATGTSTISWTRERSRPMLWSLLTSVGLLGTSAARGQRDPTEPWGSEFGWTVKAKPVCVRNGFPCSCGASYYYWLHTWRAWPCPALPVPAPAVRGLCSKPRLGKHRFVRTLICPGVFSKLKLFVIIIRIIIDFYRLSSLFSVMFFFLLKKVGVLLID